MLCGGTESCVTPLAIGGFTSMKALSQSTDPKRASIPFDLERNGFVLGEGAGVLLLEELEHAQKRGAPIYAEILGYGVTCDAYHMTAPLPDGSGGAKAMAQALADGGVLPEQVDYINAHGTATRLNDAGETAAIKAVFGDHAKHLAVSSTKSMTGHMLGCLLYTSRQQEPWAPIQPENQGATQANGPLPHGQRKQRKQIPQNKIPGPQWRGIQPQEKRAGPVPGHQEGGKQREKAEPKD